MKNTLRVLVLFIFFISAKASFATPPSVEDFFKDAAFSEIKISPDGSMVAALSEWHGHLNLYSIDMKTKKPLMLTGFDHMDVTEIRWGSNKRILFRIKEDGYYRNELFGIDADGKSPMASLAGGGVRQASILGPYGNSEDEILIVSNERRISDPDVYKMNIHTGSKKMVAWNPGKIHSWGYDNKGLVRVGVGTDETGIFLIYREGERGEFRQVKHWNTGSGNQDRIEPLGFDEGNRLLYVRTNLNSDTAAICLMDPTDGAIVRELFRDDTYDCDGIITAREPFKLLGFHLSAEKPQVVWADEDMKTLQTIVDKELPHTTNLLTSRSKDGAWNIYAAFSDRDAGSYYLVNSKERTMERLVSLRPWLKPESMSEMRPITYKARDGLTIHGYLTLPVGKEPKHLPLIVNPHGGPWARDNWGFNDEVQFLSSRGYAVLQINFRGSIGYGRKFLEAGYGQWGLAMQDDITDGVKWAIAEGYAAPDQIAIYGASYGGYATMAGLAFTPDLYRCGINYVGVTDIALLLKTLPESWERQRKDVEAMTGKAHKEREKIEATSPLKNANKIKVPVFFAYGEGDDRVDIKHGTRLASILRGNGVPVEWMSRTNEGHGYRNKENVYDFYSTMETFLDKYLLNHTKSIQSEVHIGEPKTIEMPVKEPTSSTKNKKS